MVKVVKLNTSEQSPMCSICIYSKQVPGQAEKYLCSKKGMVAYDFKCRKFSLDIMSKNARRRHSLGKTYDPKDFLI